MLSYRHNYKTPYPPASAMSGGYSTATGNRGNIVVDINVYNQIIYKANNANYNHGYQINSVIRKIEEISSTTFILPETGKKIEAYTTAMKKILVNDFQDLTSTLTDHIRNFLTEICTLDGGDADCPFVVNEAEVDNIRTSCESFMKRQLRAMKETEEEYRRIALQLENEATTLEARAREQDLISSTTTIEEARHLRSQASNKRDQATALRSQARVITNETDKLSTTIHTTGRFLQRLVSQAQEIDSRYSRIIANDITAIDAFIMRVQSLIDGITDVIVSDGAAVMGVSKTYFKALLGGLDAMKLAGQPQFCALGLEPVNLATGNFILTKEDIAVHGHSPLIFKRFYNSISSSKGTLGLNWTHNHNICLSENEGTISIAFADGHVEIYRRQSDGSFASAGNNNTLIKEEDNYTLTLPTFEKYSFNAMGQLTIIVEANDNITQFTYTDDLLNKVTTSCGSLNFSYDNYRFLSEVSDHSGRKVVYEYKNRQLVKVTLPSGAVLAYDYDLSGLLSKATNPLGIDTVRNEYDDSGRVVKQYLADGGVSAVDYDDEKMVTTVTEQNGHKIRYVRDEQYRTTRIIDEDGEEQFGYNDKNQRILYIDKLGNEQHFTYNSVGNIVTITDPLSVKTEVSYTKANQAAKVFLNGQKIVSHSYDLSGKLTAAFDALNNKIEISYGKNGLPDVITQADEGQLLLEYDERGNITQFTDASGVKVKRRYNDLNQVTAFIYGNGNETKYRYDTAGNVVEEENALGDIRITTYNKANKVVRVNDFDGSVVTMEYNSINKPSKLTDQLGRETLLKYDNMWNLTQIVKPSGAETKLFFGKQRRVETVIQPNGTVITYQYDLNGNRTGITDEAGHYYQMKYNAVNLLIEITDPDGFKISYTYNAARQRTSATDSLGNTVYLTYNAAGMLIKETNTLGESRHYTYTPLNKIATITNEADLVTKFEYQLGGRILAVYYPDKTKESYTYDKAGNIETITDRFKQTKTYSYDGLNRIVKITNAKGDGKSYVYDRVNNITSMTNENGATTHYAYTLTRQLAKVTDALGNEVVYTYNNCDELIAVRQNGTADININNDPRQVSSNNAGNEHSTFYERDLMGRVTGITDALGQTETRCYDVRGQLIEKLDRDGHLTKYGYTSLGDMNHIQYADGREVKFSYNPLRQLIAVEDWLGQTKIEVDELGRARKITDHKGDEVSYTYNVAGLRTGMTYPGGREVSYEFDEVMRLKAVSDGDFNVRNQYDSLSRLIEKSFSNGTKTLFDYNDFDQLGELSHIDIDGVLDHFKYTYDLAGNKVGIHKERRGLPNESGLYSFGYDLLDRLLEVRKDEQLQRSYEYDEYGNRTKLIEGKKQTLSTFNCLNQLLQSVDNSGDEQSFSYDKRGNLTEIHRNGVMTNKYQFGAFNRLEQAVNYSSALSTDYRYSGLGFRIGSSTYADDLQVLIQTEDIIDATRQYNNLLEHRVGSTVTDFLWDGGLLAMMSADGVHSFLLDEMGSPIRVGEEVYGYSEFGTPTVGVARKEQPFGFTGYRYDHVAETYFAQAREFMPEVGRFSSQDTHWNPHNMIYGDYFNKGIVPNFDAIRQSVNIYSYCLSNSLRYIDPSGKIIELCKNTTEHQRLEYERAIEYLKTSEDGKTLIEKLENSTEVITIEFTKNPEGSMYSNPKTITWNYEQGLIMLDRHSVMSPAMSLIHEMGHAAQDLDGEIARKRYRQVENANLRKYENSIAEQLGEPVRGSYINTAGSRKMSNSTHHITSFWSWTLFRRYTVHHNAFPIVGDNMFFSLPNECE
jgi:RHS repeat-associated protein/prepilin-type processing-associated H-X9-DG protein